MLSPAVLFLVTSIFAVGDSSPTVSTRNGAVTGTVETVDGRHVRQFLGIPFAQPPVGPLRLSRPQPVRRRWSEPLRAIVPPKGCLQSPQELGKWPLALKPRYSEDCLYLNVWSPTSARERKPVMVWIHGGSYNWGEGLPMYNGKALAVIGDVVVVVIQYRLGFLGFARLDDRVVPGNLGLLDQQLALRWVHENIAGFGGDPDLVTIFGESAGGSSVSLHLLNEESSRYFRRAIVQSGSVFNYWAFTADTAALEALNRRTAAKYLGCDQGAAAAVLECIRGRTESEMAAAVMRMTKDYNYETLFNPTVDGAFLSSPPEEAVRAMAPKDLLLGVVEDEAGVYVQLYAQTWLGGAAVADPPLNASFVGWVLRDLLRYYPAYPRRPSPRALAVARMRAMSHVDPSSGARNARRLSARVSEFMIDCGVNALADAARRRGSTVYFYQMGYRATTPLFHVPSAAWMGASHMDDIPRLFAYPVAHAHLKESMNAVELAIGRRMIADFAAFAGTGRPRDPRWAPFSLERKEFLRYDATSQPRDGGVRRDACAFWDLELPLVNGLCPEPGAAGARTVAALGPLLAALLGPRLAGLLP